MAKKTAAPKPHEGAGDKPVRLLLSPETHARLRVVAAEAGKPMAVYVRELVELHVEQHTRKAK